MDDFVFKNKSKALPIQPDSWNGF